MAGRPDEAFAPSDLPEPSDLTLRRSRPTVSVDRSIGIPVSSPDSRRIVVFLGRIEARRVPE